MMCIDQAIGDLFTQIWMLHKVLLNRKEQNDRYIFFIETMLYANWIENSSTP